MRVVLTTCKPEDAERIAKALVASGAACVNIIAGVRSIYTWKGEVCDDNESLLVVKAAGEQVEPLRLSLPEIHPYDLPEWVVLDVDTDQTSDAYRMWVRSAGT